MRGQLQKFGYSFSREGAFSACKSLGFCDVKGISGVSRVVYLVSGNSQGWSVNATRVRIQGSKEGTVDWNQIFHAFLVNSSL